MCCFMWNCTTGSTSTREMTEPPSSSCWIWSCGFPLAAGALSDMYKHRDLAGFCGRSVLTVALRIRYSTSLSRRLIHLNLAKPASVCGGWDHIDCNAAQRLMSLARAHIVEGNCRLFFHANKLRQVQIRAYNFGEEPSIPACVIGVLSGSWSCPCLMIYVRFLFVTDSGQSWRTISGHVSDLIKL
jgi:hypothetical protein